MDNIEFHEKDGSITLSIRVIPRASRSEIVGGYDGGIKVKLRSPPVDGAANDELVRLLSKELGVSRANIEILAGHSSRQKRVRLTDTDLTRVVNILKAKS